LDMARNHTQHRTTAIVLSIAALASCSLTACSSSSDPASQTRSLSPQQVAIQQRQYAESVEIFNCARHRGVRLPPPTTAGVNVSGVKGRRREVAVSDCYQKALKKAARQERGERAEAQ
jgi:hypothetical protein